MANFYAYQPPIPAAVPYNSFAPYTPQPAQYTPQPPYSPQIPGYPQSYFPAYNLQPTKPPTPPPQDQLPAPPDLTSITPAVAKETIRRVLVSELSDAGFSSSDAQALDRLERDVVAFIQRLYERAHQYANLSNRSGAIATDMILACEELDIVPEKLRPMRSKMKRKKKSKEVPAVPSLLPARSRSPSPTRLPSDDEVAPIIPVTLRGLPHSTPKIPPKHTYLRTPASPPKRAAIPTLEKKLETAGLVQTSLKNLMVATADAKGQEEGELLGHIVNSETAIHPRKRWKLTQSSSRKSRNRPRTSIAS
ncbi:hypothetical protein MIND_00713000 [Mycena indigotica]|uniref:Transcription initiation factor TFIID subunit 8 n=1 Tax=Mycena indigotica TaxID=2126181 RepID=A0A8H6SL89_9AGAR|nr:uncharacterized protein MIND_00713000 [Mycena indigotica]KAF7301476.1 hypothetical protein MIND_00713000 [Mycena indigotica]